MDIRVIKTFVFHKAGFIISYADILLLYDVWGLKDVPESNFIPQEIARDDPAICIVDNDDFKIDTLTGNSQQIHRTNVNVKALSISPPLKILVILVKRQNF